MSVKSKRLRFEILKRTDGQRYRPIDPNYDPMVNPYSRKK